VFEATVCNLSRIGRAAPPGGALTRRCASTGKERVLIEALIGAAVGVLTIALARIIRGQRWLYSLGLLTLPGLYAFFALQAGEQAVGVKEVIYGVPFVVVGLIFAFASVRHSAVVVGAFWILHGLYDLTHSQFFTNPGVPGWYPVFCFSVDVVVGAYLLWLSRRISNANIRQA
jgi:hypothetical protein